MGGENILTMFWVKKRNQSSSSRFKCGEGGEERGGTVYLKGKGKACGQRDGKRHPLQEMKLSHKKGTNGRGIHMASR